MSMASSFALVSLVYAVVLFLTLYIVGKYFIDEHTRKYQIESRFIFCVFWPVTVPFFLAVALIVGITWLVSRPFAWIPDWFESLHKKKIDHRTEACETCEED